MGLFGLNKKKNMEENSEDQMPSKIDRTKYDLNDELSSLTSAIQNAMKQEQKMAFIFSQCSLMWQRMGTHNVLQITVDGSLNIIDEYRKKLEDISTIDGVIVDAVRAPMSRIAMMNIIVNDIDLLPSIDQMLVKIKRKELKEMFQKLQSFNPDDMYSE